MLPYLILTIIIAVGVACFALCSTPSLPWRPAVPPLREEVAVIAAGGARGPAGVRPRPRRRGGRSQAVFDEWRRDSARPAVGRVLDISLRVPGEEPVVPGCRLQVWDAGEAEPLPFRDSPRIWSPHERLPAWVSVQRNVEVLQTHRTVVHAV
ncbi:hypothetical protein LSM04_000499 [Trypanosoma melophagium]|uniref:uncharacterized protein n=1 Tax=Trypanosoma melophagium TaxID=715481 RepID=UPI00351A3A93|nr:hypothetical protein LSM04_000499 [Trypanosoma melophagium]